MTAEMKLYHILTFALLLLKVEPFAPIPSLQISHKEGYETTKSPMTLMFSKNEDRNNDEGGVSMMNRRKSIQQVASVATATLLNTGMISSISNVEPVLAASDGIDNSSDQPKKEFINYESADWKLSFVVPATFKIITNKIGSSSKNNNNSNGQLFSALDLNSGAVITVHRENACPISRYVNDSKSCDLLLPPPPADDESAMTTLLSKETMKKDATKLLIRHDERDNAALGGTSTIQSVEQIFPTSSNSNNSDSRGIKLVANTMLPTGGTYRDEMGLIRESMITRVVQSNVVLQKDSRNGDMSLLQIWISAPLDEWQKPVMGTKLRKIVDSINIEGGEIW